MEEKHLADLTTSGSGAALPGEADSAADFYAAAANSFQIHLDWLEQQGRKETPEWHLANGLLRLAQGLQRDREAQDDRVKSFARSSSASDLPLTGDE